jgi:hypothetical protein
MEVWVLVEAGELVLEVALDKDKGKLTESDTPLSLLNVSHDTRLSRA